MEGGRKSGEEKQSKGHSKAKTTVETDGHGEIQSPSPDTEIESP